MIARAMQAEFMENTEKQPEANPTVKRRSVKLAIFANWYGVLVTAISQIALVPFFLMYWSKSLYGDWLILFSLPWVLTLADFGIGPVTANHISIAVGRNDRKGAQIVLQSGGFLVLLISIILFVLIILVAEFMDVRRIFGISNMTSDQASRVLLAFGWLIIVWMQLPILLGIFQGYDEFGFGTFVTNSIRLTLVPVTIIALYLKATPFGVALALGISQTLGYAIINFYCWHQYKDLRFGTSFIRNNMCVRLIKDGIISFGITLSSLLTNYGPLLVIGHTLGPKSVVTFSVVRTLSRMSALFATGMRLALVPEFSFLYGARDSAAMWRLMRLATLRTAGVAALIGAGTVVLGKPVVLWWTHNSVTASTWLLCAFAFCSLFQSLSSIPGGVVFSTNKTRFISFWLLVSALAAIALTKCFSVIFGLTGAAFALVLGELFGVIFTFMAAVRLLSKP